MSFKFHSVGDFELRGPIGMIAATAHLQGIGQTYVADTCARWSRPWKKGMSACMPWLAGTIPAGSCPRGALSGVKTVGFWDADHGARLGPRLAPQRGHRADPAGERAHGLRRRRAGAHAQARRPDDHPPLAIASCGQSARGRRAVALADSGCCVRRPHQAWKWPPGWSFPRPT